MSKNHEANSRHTGRRGNLWAALWTAGGYLVIFLAARVINGGLGRLGFWEWLLDTSPARSNYVFGWLLTSNLYLISSLISILPALFGAHRFSAATLAGFLAGLLAGELFGANPAGEAYGMGHYGWAIWGVIFLVSMVIGVFLELRGRRGNTRRQRSGRSRPPKETEDGRTRRAFGAKMALLFFGVLLVLLAVILIEETNRPRLITQGMECILEVPYDPASFIQFVPGSEITWWDQFHYKEDLNDEFETRRADVSAEDWDALEIDLNQFSYIVSFGRKIVEIQYWDQKDDIFYSYSADVTFAEQYDGAVLYVYRGPRYSFLPFEDYKDIYIMQGDQRVYWGLLNKINERIPSADHGL